MRNVFRSVITHQSPAVEHFVGGMSAELAAALTKRRDDLAAYMNSGGAIFVHHEGTVRSEFGRSNLEFGRSNLEFGRINLHPPCGHGAV